MLDMNGHVRPLRLPADCPPATNYGVEITLHSGEKAAIIASYLPQPMEEHKRTCHALARLPATLPYHLLIIGGDLQGHARTRRMPSPKLRMLASDMFLNDDEDEEMGEEEESEDEEIQTSELEENLFLSQVPFTLAFDLLGWWKSRSRVSGIPSPSSR